MFKLCAKNLHIFTSNYSSYFLTNNEGIECVGLDERKSSLRTLDYKQIEYLLFRQMNAN